MHCLLSVVSILIDFRYMHVCDWASHTFLPMIPCKGCSLAKIQHHSLSSLIRVPHHHFTYDTVLRYTHCERPKGTKRTGTKRYRTLRLKIAVGSKILVPVQNTTGTNAPNIESVFY
jgi:hypothetical protein